MPSMTLAPLGLLPPLAPLGRPLRLQRRPAAMARAVGATAWPGIAAAQPRLQAAQPALLRRRAQLRCSSRADRTLARLAAGAPVSPGGSRRRAAPGRSPRSRGPLPVKAAFDAVADLGQDSFLFLAGATLPAVPGPCSRPPFPRLLPRPLPGPEEDASVR